MDEHFGHLSGNDPPSSFMFAVTLALSQVAGAFEQMLARIADPADDGAAERIARTLSDLGFVRETGALPGWEAGIPNRMDDILEYAAASQAGPPGAGSPPRRAHPRHSDG